MNILVYFCYKNKLGLFFLFPSCWGNSLSVCIPHFCKWCPVTPVAMWCVFTERCLRTMALLYEGLLSLSLSLSLSVIQVLTLTFLLPYSTFKELLPRTWKQPRCPSADEWIRKLRYMYTMEYYPAIKKNSFESVLMRWMKPESIIQSEVSQKDKH